MTRVHYDIMMACCDCRLSLSLTTVERGARKIWKLTEALRSSGLLAIQGRKAGHGSRWCKQAGPLQVEGLLVTSPAGRL